MIIRRGAVSTCVVVIVFGAAAGCASTKKKYEKGVEAEQAGRYEEAAELYIQVLRKEPEWDDARARLEMTGRYVIDNYRDEATARETGGEFVVAADILARLDSFYRRASAVGARLELPADFAEWQNRMEDLAVGKLLRDADDARRARRWVDALRLYDRALQRGRLSESESAAVHESRAVALVEWADESLSAGRYRMAFEKSQQAIDVVGPTHRLAERARSVQRAALERGSRFVAVLPVAAREGVYRDASGLLLTDISDILSFEHWAHPPPFILMADPIAVRRELRTEVGRRGRVVSRGEAIAVGRMVEADWVVAPEIGALDRTERVSKRKTVKARTRGRNPLDTTYVVSTVDVRYAARGTIRIYDVASGERLYEGNVDATLEDRYERGEYQGDYRHLDLSGSELSYFDPEELRVQTDRMEEALADVLAHKIAERVYSRTTSWIQ